MTTAIHAIYENGVSRPTKPVDLPDHCEVEVEVRAVKARGSGQAEREFPEEKSIVLSDRDRDPFLQLLENPPPPNAALQKAVSEYGKRFGQRLRLFPRARRRTGPSSAPLESRLHPPHPSRLP